MKLIAVSTACFNPVNREFYRRLANFDIKVVLVVPAYWDLGKGINPTIAKQPEDPPMHFLNPTNFHPRLYLLKGIEQVIQSEKPDVIYLEGDPGSRISVKLGQLAKKSGARFWAISCENLPQDPLSVSKREGVKNLPAAIVKYWLIIRSRRFIDRLFVINSMGKALFEKMKFKNVTRTPLGFNEKLFKIDNYVRDKIRLQLKIPDDIPVIAYFGRMVPEKGVHLLIEALAQLKDKAWRLMLDDFDIYRSPYLKNIKHLIDKHNLQDRVVYIHANHQEIAGYMNAADVVVLPSISTGKWVEQYGRVIPEAMACGKRVIVSDSGAPKEMVFNSDWIVREGDGKNLAHMLNSFIHNHAQDEYEIQKYAHDHWSIKRQVQVFEDQFRIQ